MGDGVFYHPADNLFDRAIETCTSVVAQVWEGDVIVAAGIDCYWQAVFVRVDLPFVISL